MQGSNANEAATTRAPPAAQGTVARPRVTEPDPIQSRHLR